MLPLRLGVAAASRRVGARGLAAAAARVFECTAANFQVDVMKNPVPVLLQCTAEWCGPCKQLSPLVKAECAKYPGKVEYATLDIDQEQELANRLQIKSVPTVFGVAGGTVAEGMSFVGGQTPEFVKDFVAKLASLAPAGAADDGSGSDDVTERRLGAFASYEAGKVDEAAKAFEACFLAVREAQGAALAAVPEVDRAKKAALADFDEKDPLALELAWCLVGIAQCALCPPREADAATALLAQLRDPKRSRVLDGSEELRAAIAAVRLGLDADRTDDALHPARLAFAQGDPDKALALALAAFKAASTDEDKARAKALVLEFCDAHGATSTFSKTARQRLANAIFA